MHISIGAAILILGVLFLATSRAGLKVLGVLFVVGVVGGYLVLNGYVDDAVRRLDRHDALAQQQECAAKAVEAEHYETETFRKAIRGPNCP
jgi:hypothetical protein